MNRIIYTKYFNLEELLSDVEKHIKITRINLKIIKANENVCIIVVCSCSSKIKEEKKDSSKFQKTKESNPNESCKKRRLNTNPCKFRLVYQYLVNENYYKCIKYQSHNHGPNIEQNVSKFFYKFLYLIL